MYFGLPIAASAAWVGIYWENCGTFPQSPEETTSPERNCAALTGMVAASLAFICGPSALPPLQLLPDDAHLLLQESLTINPGERVYFLLDVTVLIPHGKFVFLDKSSMLPNRDLLSTSVCDIFAGENVLGSFFVELSARAEEAVTLVRGTPILQLILYDSFFDDE